MDSYMSSTHLFYFTLEIWKNVVVRIWLTYKPFENQSIFLENKKIKQRFIFKSNLYREYWFYHSHCEKRPLKNDQQDAQYKTKKKRLRVVSHFDQVGLKQWMKWAGKDAMRTILYSANAIAWSIILLNIEKCVSNWFFICFKLT